MPISVSTSSLLPSMSTRVTAYLVERRYLLQFCFVLLLSVHISVYFFSCVVLLLSVHYFCILLQFFCLLLSVHFSVYFFSSFALTAIRTNVCYLLQFFCSDSFPYIFLLFSSVCLFWQLSVHFSVYFFRFCVLTAFHTCFCILVDTELWIHALVILYPVRSVTTVMSFTDMVVMLFGWSMLYQSPGPDSWSPWSTPADVVLLLVDFSSNKLCKYVCLLVSWDHM